MKKFGGIYDNYKKGQVSDFNAPAFAFKNDDSLSVLHQDLEKNTGKIFEMLRVLASRWNDANKKARQFSFDKALESRSTWTQEELQELENYQRQINQEREKAHREYLDLLLFYITTYENKK